MLAGLTKTGSPSASITSSAVPAPTSCSVKDSQRLWAMPCWAEHLLGHRLVHGQRRAEHAAADVGHVGQLEQPLHGAVLAQRSVQQRQHDGGSGRHGGGEDGRGRGRPPVDGQPVGQGQRIGGRSERRAWPPRPAATRRRGRCRRRDRVAVGVDGAQHVRRRHPRDVVLGRLAAEEHDEVDALGGTVPAGRPPRDGRTRPGTFGGMRFSARLAAAGDRGELVGPDVALDGASFDSRTLRPGQLFVPLVAERDGHEFIAAAVAAGAPAYLTARPVDEAAASRHRRGATPPPRSWTWGAGAGTGWRGSRPGGRRHRLVGKTTVKDLAAAALGARWRTAANARGLTTTSRGCRSPSSTPTTPPRSSSWRWACGDSGEIARLCEVGRPTIGVVTVVAAAHTERVGGLDGRRPGQGRARRRAAGRRHRGAQRRRPPGGGDGGAGAAAAS